MTIEENKGKKFAVDYYVFAWRFNRWNGKVVTCLFFRVPALVDSLAREKLVA